ncbi:3-oxo-5-alpha-steroid 4-dehydrogenase 1 isoform X1 [Ornithorhynchus anatinus]|uniref:3-oxo-5-alpha-steroid 4-dehydrogenase 1 isoform X1 n=1 Tax=Ornithorhynchus anatinus TaxID=9258 RepID=UPI0010A8B5EF|nr:3-oxo-5-alpha-steroid 4-dehydrogenase 1 isoform X1 [Ornithorhynchus anatinus]
MTPLTLFWKFSTPGLSSTPLCRSNHVFNPSLNPVGPLFTVEPKSPLSPPPTPLPCRRSSSPARIAASAPSLTDRPPVSRDSSPYFPLLPGSLCYGNVRDVSPRSSVTSDAQSEWAEGGAAHCRDPAGRKLQTFYGQSDPGLVPTVCRSSLGQQPPTGVAAWVATAAFEALDSFRIPTEPVLSLVFPFLIRGGKPTPVSTFIMAFLFCSFNGYLQGQNLSKYAVYPTSWLRNPRFIIGFLLWLIGMLINIHSDHILRNLRKPGETGYKIPRGGLFEYVSGANFFGEIVEWYGYALASWSVEGAAFATFSASFLINRAQLHHRWYLEKFEDYPKLRKILIPFLF